MSAWFWGWIDIIAVRWTCIACKTSNVIPRGRQQHQLLTNAAGERPPGILELESLGLNTD
jgi:hypothetical protein